MSSRFAGFLKNISFFSKMKIDVQTFRKIESLQQQNFIELDNIFKNFVRIPLIKDRYAELAKNQTPVEDIFMSAFDKVNSLCSDPVLTYSIMNNFITEFARHSSENYQMGGVVQRNLYNQKVDKKEVGEYFLETSEQLHNSINSFHDTIKAGMQLAKCPKDPIIGRAYINAYFALLSDVQNIFHATMKQSVAEMKYQLHLNEFPDILVNQTTFISACNKFSIQPELFK